MAGSPIFRRITLTEVKKTSNKRGSLLRELAGLEREEKEIIKNHHDPSYSNWRSSFLIEDGMTTDGFMQTQLKGEGDTDLATIAGNVEASYQAYEGGSDALSNTAITASGTGSGSSGGFDLGKDYLAFNGNSTPRYAALKAIDSSKFDTIVVTGIRGNDSNGGEDPDEENEDLMVYYQLPGQNTIQRLDVSGGVTQSGIDYKIIPIGSDDSGLQEYSLTLPSYTRAEGVRFILYQPSHHGTGFDNYGVTQINYRRVKPISVFVSLDSPEASSFMRIGSPSKASESKKQREKQLREQLEATKDYTDKKFGENFPGSEVAAPGDEDPTEVEKKAPGLGEFEPEVVDYNTWKQETKKEDPKAQTTEKEYEKWKDDKRLKSFAAVRDAQAEKPTAPATAATSDKKDFDTFKDDSTPQSGMQLDKLVPKGDDTKENDKQQLNLLKNVEKGLINITKDKTESGVSNSALYNLSLAGSLATSMITGLPGEIKLTTKGAEDMASYLRPTELADVITFNTTTPMDAENTLNPVGKTDQVLKGSLWGIQGGSTFNVNLETGNLEVVSNKTIRTTSGGESVTRNADGKIVRFSDIPEPKPADVERVTRQLVSNPVVDKFLGGIANVLKFATGNNKVSDGIKTYNNAWDYMKSQPDYDEFIKTVARIAEPSGTLIADTVQGVASNAYAVRQALINLGLPQSDIEKMGGALGQVSSMAEIPLDKLKEINPEAYDAIMKKAKEDGYTVGADGKLTQETPEWTGTEEQQEDLHKDLNDLYDTDPDRFMEVMQEVQDNPQYVKAQDEYKAAEEKFKFDKEERKRIGNEWFDLKQLDNIGDVYSNLLRSLDPSTKYGGDPIYGSYRTRYGAGSFAKDAEKIATLGGIDYKEVQKLQKDYALFDESKYKFTPAKKNASGNYISSSISPDENWAMDQKEYKAAKVEYDKNTKTKEAEWAAWEKAIRPVVELEKQLAHPTKKGYVTGTSSQLAEYDRLSALAKKAGEKWDKASDLYYNTQSPKLRQVYDKLVKEREDAEKKLKEMSKEADDNIKALIKDLKSQMDELDKGGALGKFDPDGELMKKQMSAWDKAAYDALNPRTPPQLDRGGSDALPPPEGYPDPTKDPDAYKDFDLSKKDPLDGTKIASATKDKLIKKMEDATSKGDTEALEKYLKQYKELDSEEKRGSGAGFDVNIDDLRQSGLPDGTQIAGAPSSRVGAGLPTGRGTNRGQAGDGGSITTDSDFGKRMRDAVLGLGNIQAKTSQKDFGSIAQAYGGQGVDAATLASTASATQTKKKKKRTTVTASYKPKGSMITEKRKLKSPHDWFNPDDIKPEYPKDPPPEMVNNYHPDLVDSAKKAERFNKLDPASAKAMPKQDDPNIDAKVEKAKKNPDKDGPEWHKKVSDKIRMARAQQR